MGKKRLIKRAELFAGRNALKFFSILFRALPWNLAYSIGRGAGSAAYRLSKKRRRIAHQNLTLAFPHLSTQDRSAIARRLFKNLGMGIVDFFKMPSLSDDPFWRRVEFCGQEAIDEALAEGRGLLFVTGHFGAWEIMGSAMARLGYDFSVVARDTNDEETTDLVNQTREKAGMSVHARGNAARFILSKLKANKVIGIVPDQNAGDAFITFFGHPVGTVVGPAVMSLRTGAAIVTAFAIRKPDGSIRVEAERMVLGADERAIMQSIHDAIERYARAYPDQYLWIHDRWKSARQAGMLG
ncbi:MAG: lysophospholipid acyltransferase family protein [Armatimonadetes bacterium]|nr:lysophospholipid acyltransferase family protein [Armatimonadota bacterium]